MKKGRAGEAKEGEDAEAEVFLCHRAGQGQEAEQSHTKRPRHCLVAKAREMVKKGRKAGRKVVITRKIKTSKGRKRVAAVN